MYPTPRHELEGAESQIEEIINKFISRAIEEIRQSGYGKEKIILFLNELENDEYFSSLMTEGNFLQIKDLREDSAYMPSSISSAEDSAKRLEDRQADYSATRNEEVRRLNAAYDFNSIAGVTSIPVPCREVNGTSATGRVEYYLRGQCFFQHWTAGNTELALACLRKAQELMYVSDMTWRKTDFLRLVCYLYEAWKDDEAEKELERINSFFAQKEVNQDNFLMVKAKELQTDLVEVTPWRPYCGECAKYINRVFSISGKDKRFPALPREVFLNDGGHHLSCLHIYPFVYRSSTMYIKRERLICKNVIEYSNRPFIDERTQDEIDRYSNYCIRMQQKAVEEARQCELMVKRSLQKREDIQTLKWLSENLPKLCPKSLSGFRRMRTTNSKNYQKLVVEAERLGRKI